MFDFAPNDSFEPVVKLISPDEVVVTTNCFLNVNDVCDTPEFASVFNVLILFFLSFLRSKFFCWSRSWFLNLIIWTDVTAVAELLASVKEVLDAIALTLAVKSLPEPPAPGTVTKSPTFRSRRNVVLKPVTVAFEPFIETLPPRVSVELNTVSAVKSAPVFGEFMNTDFTSSKFLVVIAATVTAALLEFSINWLALLLTVCDDEIRFSPTINVPDTVIKSTKLLTALWTNPVAPDVAPVICEPAATPVGLPAKFALSWIVVNIRISKRYKLNCELVTEELASAFTPAASLPDACSNPRALATPINWLGVAPLLAFLIECNSTVRYGSAISPEIKGDMSGEPNTFSTLTKLPTSTPVIAESKLSVVLGFGKSMNVGITVLISYPRTYALPGSIWIVAFASEGVFPWSETWADV